MNNLYDPTSRAVYLLREAAGDTFRQIPTEFLLRAADDLEQAEKEAECALCAKAEREARVRGWSEEVNEDPVSFLCNLKEYPDKDYNWQEVALRAITALGKLTGPCQVYPLIHRNCADIVPDETEWCPHCAARSMNDRFWAELSTVDKIKEQVDE